MLRTHEELLPNWFRAKGDVSSGLVEGSNNKIGLGGVNQNRTTDEQGKFLLKLIGCQFNWATGTNPAAGPVASARFSARLRAATAA